MPGSFGSHLGQIDLTLRHDQTGWRVTAQRSRLLTAVATAAPNRDLVAPYHRAARDFARQPVAQMTRTRHSYFARFANDGSVQLLAKAQAHAARHLIQGSSDEKLPLVSVATSFRTGGTNGRRGYLQIPAGPLNRHHLTELYPFEDQLCLTRLTGQDLRLWMEHSARNFHTIVPGRPDQPLLNPEVPGYLFDHFLGLTYEFDLTAQPGNRVRNLRWQGQGLKDDQIILTVGNSFRMSHAGGLPKRQTSVPTGLSIHAVLERYFTSAHWRRTESRGKGQTAEIWRFTKIGNTSVLVPTVLPALNHLEGIAHLSPEAQAATPPGSVQLKLHL
jgi:2',3'-cyclic-nucleotide 2'-phosphodiesterase/3'-nucleotidase